MKGKSVVSIVIVILILLVTKLSGLFRDAVVVSVYGASLFSDGFFLSLSIVLTLYALIGKAITLYLIPRFDQNETDYTIIKSFIIKGSIFSLLFVGIYHLFCDQMIQFFYTGQVDNDIRRLFTSSVYASVFVPAIYTLVAYHQNQKRFYQTTLIGLFFNLTLIFSVLFRYSGILIFILGLMIQFIMLLYKLDFKKLIYAKVVKMKLREFIPITSIAVTMAFEQLNVLVDRKYISAMGSGQLTLLDLGSKVSFMFMGIVVLGVTTVIYPKLNDYYKNKKYKSFMSLMRKATILIVSLSVIGTVVLIIGARFIVDFLFARGELYPENVEMIVLYLKIYSLTLLPLSLREMMIRFMILRGREDFLIGTSLIGLGLNIYISMTTISSVIIIGGTIGAVILSTAALVIPFLREIKVLKIDNNL
jgi:putative peptidoglycan lipid II flippase